MLVVVVIRCQCVCSLLVFLETKKKRKYRLCIIYNNNSWVHSHECWWRALVVYNIQFHRRCTLYMYQYFRSISFSVGNNAHTSTTSNENSLECIYTYILLLFFHQSVTPPLKKSEHYYFSLRSIRPREELCRLIKRTICSLLLDACCSCSDWCNMIRPESVNLRFH
jgi:hypothetical protein